MHIAESLSLITMKMIIFKCFLELRRQNLKASISLKRPIKLFFISAAICGNQGEYVDQTVHNSAKFKNKLMGVMVYL
jgi:hypothetical protein